MSKEINLKAIISCVDKLSPALSKMDKSIQGFGKRMRTLNRAGKNVGRAFTDLGSTIAKPVTLITGVLGYSLVSASKNFAAYADALAATAQKAGVTTTALQELQYAAAVNGSSAETMSAAMTKLNKQLYDAATGKNKEAASLFSTLGISIKDASGNIRRASDLMPELAQGFALNTDAATRTKMAMTLFGESGTALLPLLTQGSAGLAAMSERAKKFGFVVSDEAVNAGGLLNNMFAELDMSMRAFTGELIKSAIPAITEIGEAFMLWLAENRELITTNVAGWIKSVGDAVRSIDWGMVKWFVEVFMTASIASRIYDIGKALVVLGKAFYAATGPVGAIVAGLVGLYEIFENWDTIKKYLTAFADYVSAWAKELFEPLAKLVPDWLKDFFTGKSQKISVDNGAGSTLATPNVGAMALSASGSVSGSLDVNVNNVATGETEKRKAALRGGVKVSGNPGYRDDLYGGD